MEMELWTASYHVPFRPSTSKVNYNYNHRTWYQERVGTWTSRLAGADTTGILTQELLPKGKTKKAIVFESLSDVAIKGRRVFNKDEQFAVRVGEKEVYRSAPSLLESRKTRAHRFSVMDTPMIYSADLKVQSSRVTVLRSSMVCLHIRFPSKCIRSSRCGDVRVPKADK